MLGDHILAATIMTVAFGYLKPARAQEPLQVELRTESADGVGETRPAGLEATAGAVLVRGRIVLGELCRGLRASAAEESDSTIVLRLQVYRLPGTDNIFCGRDENPVRYVARLAPVCSGKVRVVVRAQAFGGSEHEIVAGMLTVPPAQPSRGCAAYPAHAADKR